MKRSLVLLSTWLLGPFIDLHVAVDAASNSDSVTKHTAPPQSSDDWIQRLTQARQQAQAALQRHQDDKLTIYSDSFLTSDPMASVTKTLEASLDVSQQIQELALQRDTLVHEANTQQLLEWVEEIQLRFEAAVTAMDQASTSSPATNQSQVPRNATLDILRNLNAAEILNSSETELQQWISRVIQEEVDKELASINSRLQESMDITVAGSESAGASSPHTCVSATQAATEVHAALIRYSTAGSLQDYTAAIVTSHTSPTYVTVSKPDALAFWQRHWPQDWQDGWSAMVPRDWSDMIWAGIMSFHATVWQPQLEFLYHSIVPTTTWTRSAPPQAILQDSNYPGHCWAVAMQKQPHSRSTSQPYDIPQVTMLLQQPLQVTSITIDHVASSFLTDPELQLQSAPKRLKIYGYAPCDDRQSCAGLGFDPTTSHLLTEAHYDIHSDSNIQSFTISSGIPSAPLGASKPTKGATVDDLDHASHDGGSCSAVQTTSEPSCGGGAPDRPVAAITVQVVENWGNKDYTCLYGIRVHGER